VESRRYDLVAALAGAAFLVLGALVAAGALTRVDRYAVHRLMPWYRPSTHRLIDPRLAFMPETRPTLGGTLVALWTYPAAPFVSALLVAGCAYVAYRRGNRRLAAAVCALWLAANLIELAGKLVITRPSIGVSGLRHSYPSGHTLRAFVVLAGIAWLSRRAGAVAALWALGVPVALVLIGDHAPSDVVGGLALAACLLAVWRGQVLHPANRRCAEATLRPATVARPCRRCKT
jgi:membrane-associated phospholipid phosphatase